MPNTVIHFPVDGKWGVWTGWSKCSVTCGSGTISRSRTCTEPKYRGKPCVGSNNEDKSCDTGNCPGLCSKYLYHRDKTVHNYWNVVSI